MAESLADEIWDVVLKWHIFARSTVGREVVRAADSIGANISEGTGRGSFQDNRRFVKIARGSLNETKHYLRRAYKRNLLTLDQINKLKPILDELSPKLNSNLKSIGKIPEQPKSKSAGDPQSPDQPRLTDDGPLTTDH